MVAHDNRQRRVFAQNNKVALYNVLAAETVIQIYYLQSLFEADIVGDIDDFRLHTIALLGRTLFWS